MLSNVNSQKCLFNGLGNIFHFKNNLFFIVIYSFLRRPQFETERTYVPEQGHVNKRLGMPMEELNQSSISTSPPTTKNGGSNLIQDNNGKNESGYTLNNSTKKPQKPDF